MTVEPNSTADLKAPLAFKHYCDYQNRQWNLSASKKGGAFTVKLRAMDLPQGVEASGPDLEAAIMGACQKAGAPFSVLLEAKKRGKF